jgi:hypothetical protein
MDEHLRSIRTLLAMMDAHERADPVRTVRSVRVSGVETHVPFAPYQLPPPMTTAELEAFERKEDVCLPVEYRRAVTELGDGGATFFDSTREMLAAARRESAYAQTLVGPLLLLGEEWDNGANHWTWLVLSGEDANAVYHVDDEEDSEPQLVSRSFLSWFEQQAAREWRRRRSRTVGYRREYPDDSALWPVDALLLEVLQEQPGALERLQEAGDAAYAKDVVCEALRSVREGVIAWDPDRGPLETLLRATITSRTRHDRIRAERFPHHAIGYATTRSRRAEAAASARVAGHHGDAMVARVYGKEVVAQLRAAAPRDRDLHQLLDAYVAGATCKSEVCDEIGLSEAASHKARLRLNRLVERLDLYPTTIAA